MSRACVCMCMCVEVNKLTGVWNVGMYVCMYISTYILSRTIICSMHVGFCAQKSFVFYFFLGKAQKAKATTIIYKCVWLLNGLLKKHCFINSSVWMAHGNTQLYICTYLYMRMYYSICECCFIVVVVVVVEKHKLSFSPRAKEHRVGLRMPFFSF